MRQDQLGAFQQADADVDGVGAVAEVDGKGLHGVWVTAGRSAGDYTQAMLTLGTPFAKQVTHTPFAGWAIALCWNIATDVNYLSI
jgi:hypothetical protein